jgi:hypothetical protein
VNNFTTKSLIFGICWRQEKKTFILGPDYIPSFLPEFFTLHSYHFKEGLIAGILCGFAMGMLYHPGVILRGCSLFRGELSFWPKRLCLLLKTNKQNQNILPFQASGNYIPQEIIVILCIFLHELVFMLKL